MVGEIRDIETMKIAINASLTGHLVLSTIHTNDSASAFPRLIDMGGEPFLIATSILGVMAQTLSQSALPGLPQQPTNQTKQDIAFLTSEVPDFKVPAKIYKAKGCKKCEFKGYIGRTMIQEILVTDEEIRTLVMNHKDSHSIKKNSHEKRNAHLSAKWYRKNL